MFALFMLNAATLIKGGKVILDKVIEDWSGHISEVLFKRIIFRPSQIIVIPF
jgi:hypothetical protein